MTAEIIGIISIKGGVGKTTTIISLANILANVYKQRVLVVDANFAAPNLRLYLGLEEPKAGIHEMLQGIIIPHKSIYSTSYNFHILPAKLNNKKPTKVSDLKEHIQRLRTSYDFILIDSSPNTNAEMLATIESSDEIIPIINPDYATISCTLLAIRFVEEHKTHIKGLIVNKVYHNKNEVSFREIEKLTGLKIIGVIPHHIDIHESVLKRNPLEINKRKEYIKEYSEIVKFIMLSKNPAEKLKLQRSFSKTISKKNRARILKEFQKK